MLLAPPRMGAARARALLLVARLVSGLFLIVGILGMLRTGFDDLGAASSEPLALLTVHPVTALIHVLIGVAGTAMSTTPARARTFLVLTGALLAVWALIALLAGGPTDVLMRDVGLLVLHSAIAALSLGMALAPHGALREGEEIATDEPIDDATSEIPAGDAAPLP